MKVSTSQYYIYLGGGGKTPLLNNRSELSFVQGSYQCCIIGGGGGGGGAIWGME